MKLKQKKYITREFLYDYKTVYKMSIYLHLTRLHFFLVYYKSHACIHSKHFQYL